MASLALWQPAVLGSTGTFSSRSSSQKLLRLVSAVPVPMRRNAAVTMAGRARSTAAFSVAGDG